MSNTFNLLIGLCLSVYSMNLFGQSYSNQNTTIQIYALSNPNRNLLDNTSKDSIGNYGYTLLNFNASIPLYKSKFKKENPKFFLIKLTPTFSYQSLDLSFLKNKQNIFRIGTSVSSITYNGKKSIYIANINAFIANDDYTIYHPQVRYSGAFMYQYIKSKKISYNLGLIYTYNFGRGILLPILGLNIKTDKHTGFNINLPLGITYFNRNNNKYFYKISLKPRGNVATLTNQFGEFNTQANTVVLRQRESTLNYLGIFKPSDKFNFTFQAGLALNRHLYMSENTSGVLVNIIQSKVNNNLYIQLGFIYRIIKNNKATFTDDELDELVY